eukprot:11215599-Lingulodinium_polyedra.AAC.1
MTSQRRALQSRNRRSALLGRNLAKRATRRCPRNYRLFRCKTAVDTLMKGTTALARYATGLPQLWPR